jgi:hypothetical protein
MTDTTLQNRASSLGSSSGLITVRVLAILLGEFAHLNVVKIGGNVHMPSASVDSAYSVFTIKCSWSAMAMPNTVGFE